MGAILEQLGLDQTFFLQFALFAALFALLSKIYFKPFMHLFEARHKKTVEDREAAERLMKQAEQKFEAYKKQLSDERTAARKEYEEILNQAKKEEAALLGYAREEAKKITQDAADSAASQGEKIRKQLEADVDSLAKAISDRLLSRNT